MKRALVLSGGGSKGSWQTGVYRALAESGARYDIVTGISVGALNGSFISQYSKEDEDQAAKDLWDMWMDIRTKNVHKRHFPFGMLHGLWKPSLYNSKPLKKLVEGRLNTDAMQVSGKALRVGAVSLKTGQYRMWTQNDPDIVAGVLASSSFPAFLTPIKIDNQLWTDGGIRNVTPLKSAIEAGAEAVDIVMTMKTGRIGTISKKMNTIDVAKRSLDVLLDEVIKNDIEQATMINNILMTSGRFLSSNKRYIEMRLFYPTEKIEVDSLEFKHEEMKMLLEKGYEDGKIFLGK